MSFVFLLAGLLLPESGRCRETGTLRLAGVLEPAGVSACAPLSSSARSSKELAVGDGAALGAALADPAGLAEAGSSSLAVGAPGPAVTLSSTTGSGSVSQRKPKKPTAPRTTRAVRAQTRRPPARESSVRPVPLGVASV